MHDVHVQGIIIIIIFLNFLLGHRNVYVAVHVPYSVPHHKKHRRKHRKKFHFQQEGASGRSTPLVEEVDHFGM